MKALHIIFLVFALVNLGYAQTDSLNFGFDQKIVSKLEIPGYYDSPVSISLKMNGKLYLTGSIRNKATSQDYFPLKCINLDGTIDSTFKQVEVPIIDTENEGFEGTSILFQDNGKIIVVGQYNRQFALARFKINGSFDETFGNSGIVTTDFNNDIDVVNSAAIQNDGKIILAGYTQFDSSGFLGITKFAFARYNSNGSLDTKFGSSGKIISSIHNARNVLKDIAIQSDGKILLVGFSRGYSDENDQVLIRYNENGSLDTSFGESGVVNTGNVSGQKILIQKDEKIIIGGNVSENLLSNFALLCYNKDGTIDSNFGDDGKVITSFLNFDYIITEKSSQTIPPPVYANLNSLYLQADGKIMASGISENNNFDTDFALSRYMPDGKLDNAFASSGKLLIDFGTETDFCYSSSYLADIGCVFAGKIRSSSSNYYDIVIYGFLNELDFGVIAQAETMKKAFVYPNPIREDFILEYELEQPAIVSINIYNINGKIIYNSLLNRRRNKGKNLENIHLPSNIPPGYYVLSIDINKNQHSVKIIID